MGKNLEGSLNIPKEYKKRLQKLNSQFSLLLRRTRKDIERQDAVKELKAAYRRLKFKIAKTIIKGFFKSLWEL